MPIWPSARRRMLLSGSRRTRRLAATLSTGLTLPVVLSGLLATPGCRGDASARPGWASISPSRWFADADDEAADEFELKPVPEGGYEAPPVPPSNPPGRAFVPPAPPAPDPNSFYGVRPTGAEEAEPGRPSWAERFRNLFRRDEEIPPLKPVPPRPSDRRSAAAERPPIPPETWPRSSDRSLPVIEPAATTAPPTELARHIEPVRPSAADRLGRLPVIVPRFAKSRPTVVEPAPWPYAVPEQPVLASTDSAATGAFPETAMSHARTAQTDGPALLR